MSVPGMPYRPVTCTFYDELALYAMHQKPILLQYETVEGDMQNTEALITDIYTLNKVEYCSLSTGQHIRLDKIRCINGKPVEAYDE